MVLVGVTNYHRIGIHGRDVDGYRILCERKPDVKKHSALIVGELDASAPDFRCSFMYDYAHPFSLLIVASITISATYDIFAIRGVLRKDIQEDEVQ